jgi:hypothetical protein
MNRHYKKIVIGSVILLTSLVGKSVLVIPNWVYLGLGALIILYGVYGLLTDR